MPVAAMRCAHWSAGGRVHNTLLIVAGLLRGQSVTRDEWLKRSETVEGAQTQPRVDASERVSGVPGPGSRYGVAPYNSHGARIRTRGVAGCKCVLAESRAMGHRARSEPSGHAADDIRGHLRVARLTRPQPSIAHDCAECGRVRFARTTARGLEGPRKAARARERAASSSSACSRVWLDWFGKGT